MGARLTVTKTELVRTQPVDARRLSLSDDDVPIALLFLVLAAIACAAPAQADTFYHLRAGRAMWESGRLLDRELFSHVTYGEPHPNHWWLGQLAFYGLHALGGPVLLTLVAGGCAWWAVFSAWTLTRTSSPEQVSTSPAVSRGSGPAAPSARST